MEENNEPTILNVAVIYPEINGVYRHYKGGTYKFLFMAKNDNDELEVVLQSLIFGSYHTKPLDVFNGYVEIEGIKTKRYTLMR